MSGGELVMISGKERGSFKIHSRHRPYTSHVVYKLVIYTVRARPGRCSSASTSTRTAMLPEWSQGPRATVVFFAATGAATLTPSFPVASTGQWNAAQGMLGIRCFGTLHRT